MCTRARPHVCVGTLHSDTPQPVASVTPNGRLRSSLAFGSHERDLLTSGLNSKMDTSKRRERS